jgi:hypothetical protein
MSLPLTAMPAPQRPGGDTRKHLRLVEQEVSPELSPSEGLGRSKNRAKLRYPVVIMIGFGALMLVQLLLSVLSSQNAYSIANAESELRTVNRQIQSTTEDIQLLTSVQNLSAKAMELGMVSNPQNVFLRLSDSSLTWAFRGAGTAVNGVTVENLAWVNSVDDLDAFLEQEQAKIAAGEIAGSGQVAEDFFDFGDTLAADKPITNDQGPAPASSDATRGLSPVNGN